MRIWPILGLGLALACQPDSEPTQPSAAELGSPALASSTGGEFAYVALESNAVSVIATATNTVIANIAGLAQPVDVAITPNGAFAYVVNTGFSNVSVIATATNTVTATVAVGFAPKTVAITPDGAFAYVAPLRPNDDYVSTHTTLAR